RPLSLGARDPARFAGAAYAFRLFLGQTEPGFAAFDGTGEEEGLSASPFGLVDAVVQSVAICRPGMMLGYGSPEAARRLDAAYRRWTALGMPGLAAFELELVRAEQAPRPRPGLWVETRGASALVWRLASAASPPRPGRQDAVRDRPSADPGARITPPGP
ncbi:MAG TPA: hypothetical protein VIQ53_06830, partial [Inquilinus sp.]